MPRPGHDRLRQGTRRRRSSVERAAPVPTHAAQHAESTRRGGRARRSGERSRYSTSSPASRLCSDRVARGRERRRDRERHCRRGSSAGDVQGRSRARAEAVAVRTAPTRPARRLSGSSARDRLRASSSGSNAGGIRYCHWKSNWDARRDALRQDRTSISSSSREDASSYRSDPAGTRVSRRGASMVPLRFPSSSTTTRSTTTSGALVHVHCVLPGHLRREPRRRTTTCPSRRCSSATSGVRASSTCRHEGAELIVFVLRMSSEARDDCPSSHSWQERLGERAARGVLARDGRGPSRGRRRCSASGFPSFDPYIVRGMRSTP